MPQDNWPVWAQFALFPCKIGEGALYFFMDEDCGLQAAERLLSLYEDGAVFEGTHHIDIPGYQGKLEGKFKLVRWNNASV